MLSVRKRKSSTCFSNGERVSEFRHRFADDVQNTIQVFDVTSLVDMDRYCCWRINEYLWKIAPLPKIVFCSVDVCRISEFVNMKFATT